MKSINKKYLIVLSLVLCLMAGSLFAKFILFAPNSPTTRYVDSVEHLYMGGGIPVYKQNADAIIIGNVREVSSPYLRRDRGITSQQDIKVAIEEVLKGDPKMTDISLLLEGEQMVTQSPNGEVSFKAGEEGIHFMPGEKVLLFIGTTSWGDHVVFAGPYGKYLIDKDNNVTSIGDFKMSLADVRKQIEEALRLPAQKYTPPPPISAEI